METKKTMVKVQYCSQAYTGLDPGSLVWLRKTKRPYWFS